MTDADVDGAHIRTLILTFLYRQMQELVERGHVYIAVAPLYRVKIGTVLRYVEKESQLEDMLVRERVKDMDVTNRSGDTQKLTESRYGRFAKVLHEFDGWASRLREDFGAAAANFVIDHRIVETGASDDGMDKALGEIEPNGYELSMLSEDDDGSVLRVLEKETGAASSVVVPSSLLASPIYANVRRNYARLVEIVGQPPFRIAFGKKVRLADTFPELREHALELAKEGIQVSRFKGLGEMDAEELADTTMNPANRMLIRVDVEDAAAADRVFSTLMGDQVEPRRAFIEQNAREVRFLDV
jgi:DNA gyrase subunit B